MMQIKNSYISFLNKKINFFVPKIKFSFSESETDEDKTKTLQLQKFWLNYIYRQTVFILNSKCLYSVIFAVFLTKLAF